MNSRCGRSAQARALGTAGEARGVPLSAPPLALRLPAPTREKLPAHDVMRLRDVTPLLARWPQPETTASNCRYTLGSSLGPRNWRRTWDPPYTQQEATEAPMCQHSKQARRASYEFLQQKIKFLRCATPCPKDRISFCLDKTSELKKDP